MYLSKRGSYYYVWYLDDFGRKRKVSTRKCHKSDALKFLCEFKQQDHKRKTKLQRVSLSEFECAYLTHSRSIHSPKTVESNATALAEFRRIVGDLPLHNVSIRDIELFLAQKREEASEWTARKYFLALASAFETARRWGHICANPFRSVDKPKVPELLPVFFSRSEFETLMKVIASEDLRELVFCAVSTGLRLAELISLVWSDVDFARRVVTVQNSERFTTKNRRSRVIPMNTTLWRVLTERQRRYTNERKFVFHKNGSLCEPKQLSKEFKRYVVLAGLNERLHFHSLRHTFASWLAQEGISLFAIQKLLGHSSASVTQIYSHLQSSELRAEVERISVSMN